MKIENSLNEISFWCIKAIIFIINVCKRKCMEFQKNQLIWEELDKYDAYNYVHCTNANIMQWLMNNIKRKSRKIINWINIS